MLDFEVLPPRLKKLLLEWTKPENWGKKLIEICKEQGWNYRTTANAISKVGKADFYELKARMIDRAMAEVHGDIIQALVEKAKKGNTRAIELYLKATKRLSDSIQIQGTLDVSIKNELLEAKKRSQELKE